MSIVALASDDAPSVLDDEELHRLAAELDFTISGHDDAQSYLLLLKSFEAVMLQVDAGDDYVHPALSPVPTTKPRSFWKPDAKDNPLNAWSHRCDITAAQPTSDLLKGRTVAVKDNVCVGGLPTTLGTHPEILTSDGHLPLSPIDATVVSRLLSAGAMIKGSSTCENFCASPLACTSVTGPVHHPLLHGYTTGGSSSGSCALVSSDALRRSGKDTFGETAELAIGGDQAGSIRNPACYTGIYGLKPTFGLVPHTGAASMTPMIDHLGPIASSIEDIATLLKVMAGWDGIDARMTPETPLVADVKNYPALVDEYRQATSEPGKPVLKVGLLTESFSVTGLSQQVRELVLKAAREGFEAAGAEVVDISVPMHSEGPVIWTAATRPSMASGLLHGKPSGHLSYLSPHIKTQWHPGQDVYQLLTQSNPAVINILLSQVFDKSHLAPSIEAKAHRKVFQLRAAYDAALARVDVLVTPCAPTVSMPHPDPRASILERLKPAIGLTSNTCPFNITGHPAMNVPCGQLPPTGMPHVKMPVGMQVVGRRWEDETVMKAAVVFEAGQKRLARA
ncbi:putative glutamyl-tRNA amidotransferase subunit A [Colletotrichum zoysiae]|uniref:Glutamyl-tRNA amidotransferase subunit A n=1 Tax=Colletotrichum zoysiae TaxID=1216348 RepID=A0AAD9H5Z5_9PEZI|nr:putative glutamyl-tRNA amidotransferase subunit A [Colletotrichum zoysiae]